jgi:hypothetical protein
LEAKMTAKVNIAYLFSRGWTLKGIPPEPVVWMPPARSRLKGPINTTAQAYRMQAEIDGMPGALGRDVQNLALKDQLDALNQSKDLAARFTKSGLPGESDEGVNLVALTAADINAILKLAEDDSEQQD